MQAVVIGKPGSGVDAWTRVERARPEPGPGQVLVRMRAASLNYRDLMIARGLYGGPVKEQLVVLSDGAGEIAAVGEGVTTLRVGERVTSAYYPTWRDGPYRAEHESSSLGIGHRDGVLAQHVVLPASGVVKMPASLSFEQAATLPCAAVTAWQALFEGAARLLPGERVLVQGTGGVSLFAAQLALASGAHVIATSSSEAKLDRLAALGVRDRVHTGARPEWHEEVLRITGGEGVDHVLDVGGAATLSRSLQAVRVGGHVAVLGLLGGMGQAIDPLPILFRSVTVEGMHVGSVSMHERLARAVDRLAIQPVVDEVLDLDDAPRALAKLAAGTHFGKIVIRVP
ncbi:zinc-dependent alcohol dehydrogenase family protein [Sandaracinus amylolyticus]|nr:NAD(P)-dependent alcohol dehydrogenase [Sandaracinus amylolyticus]